MIAQWYVEAGKYNVLPVDGRGSCALCDERPQIAVDRTSYTLLPGHAAGAGQRRPNVLNRPHSITADVEIPKDGAEGVLFSAGGVEGGYSFYVQDGKLHYVYNYVGKEITIVRSKDERACGAPRAALRVRGDRQARHPGRQRGARPGPALHRRQAGRPGRDARHDPAVARAGRRHVCGADSGSPVTSEYKPPFPFTGTLYRVTVDVSGELIEDDELAMRKIMVRQ